MESAKVLIVDDEAEMIELLKELIENLGYQPLIAQDGLFALEILKKEMSEISAVITDLNMPRMSGLEFVAKARDLGFDLPIIVESGHLDQELTIEALKLGAFDFLRKPFSVVQFNQLAKMAVQFGNDIRKMNKDIEAAFQAQGEAKVNEIKNFRRNMIQMRYKRTA